MDTAITQMVRSLNLSIVLLKTSDGWWASEGKMPTMEEAKIFLADGKDQLMAHEFSRRRNCRKMEQISELVRELAAKCLVEAGKDQGRLSLALAYPGAGRRPVPMGARHAVSGFQKRKTVWVGRRSGDIPS